jgi:hypothetical protein
LNKKVFEPEPRPRILKTNISKITQHVTKRILEIGYSVEVSHSHKSRSRYLDIKLPRGKTIVRISDHPADRNNRWRYKFDIHTSEPRAGSVDYIEFLDEFKQLAGKGAKHER